MHASHPINTQFNESMMRIQSVFESHPLLSAKTGVVNQLHGQQIERVPQLLDQFSTILTQERVLWSNIQLKPTYTPLVSQKTLDAHQKKFVLANAKAVRRVSGVAFEKLERASTHESIQYNLIGEDFAMFQQIVEGLRQLDTMQSYLDRQELLASRVSAHVAMADQVHPMIEDLRSSLLDQQVIASRLPPFKIPLGVRK